MGQTNLDRGIIKKTDKLLTERSPKTVAGERYLRI